MPGASSMINSAAAGSPNDGTGAWSQSGCCARADWRKSASRGHNGQLRSGPVGPALLSRPGEAAAITPPRAGGMAAIPGSIVEGSIVEASIVEASIVEASILEASIVEVFVIAAGR